ncbi:MAG: peptide transporter, partial [Planctomycetota bacterium]
PFPLANIHAAGATSLAETTTKTESWRWPVFSTGSMLGIVFGAVYVGIPAMTGLVLDKPLMILPIPFLDLTDNVQGVLPASLAGLSFDMGIFLFAMVLPFPMVVGIFISSMVTAVLANPVLQHLGMFPRWKPEMGLLTTKFVTDFDFWLSIGIGTALSVAALGIVRCIRSGVFKLRGALPRPEGRADIPIWFGLALFAVGTAVYIGLCHYLVPDFPLWILMIFGFVWTPLNSYISARMIGLTGRPVAFPFLREASFMLAKYEGVDIWFAPIPLHDFGRQAQLFRVLDLTRTKITSLIKAELLIIPVSLLCSFIFLAFFWYIEQIPSANYPFVAKMWPLQARYRCMFMTATMGETPWLLEAIKLRYIAAGFGAGIVLYGVVTTVGLPALFFYGLIGGVAAWPHMTIPQFAGAMVGRYVIGRRLGREKWRRYAPVLCAGYACGVGLVGMLAVGITIISRAVSGLPF